jgi:nucleoid DNA-binding protein
VNIPNLIRELLFRHERLEVPGLGTLIIVHKPAEISKTTQTLTPPSKEVRLDTQHKQGDPLLVMSIRKKFEINEAAAGEALGKFIKGIEEELRNNKSALIEGLGYVKKDASGVLSFEPLPELINLSGLFALPELEIPFPPPRSAKPEIARPVEMDAAEEDEPRRFRWWIPAAVIVVLAAVAAVVYYSGLFDRLTGTGTPEIIQAEENTGRIVFGSREASGDSTRDSLNRELDERTTSGNALRYEEPEATVPESSDLQAMSKPPASGTYHIISGSFTIPGNAEKHMASLRSKGLSPVMLPKKGKFFMVSLGSYASREEAAAAVRLLKEEMELELWVTRI